MGQEDGVFVSYKFGPFCLDTNRHVLTKQGMVVELTPRPMSVLLALVERPRQLVRKEELEKKVWDMRIGGNSLSQQILVVKKVGRVPTIGGGTADVIKLRLKYSNVHLIKSNPAILIDSGSPGDESAIESALKNKEFPLIRSNLSFSRTGTAIMQGSPGGC